MRLRRLTLPFGFAVLGLSYSLPFLLVSARQESVVLFTVLATCLAAGCGTLVWVGAAGSEPSRQRGALVGAMATLVGAVCNGLGMVAVLLAMYPLNGSFLEQAAALLLLSTLVGVLTAPLAAMLGAFVAARPSFGLSLLDGEELPLSSLGASPDATLRQLGVLVSVVVFVVLGGAFVQYADPTTPAPAADAPGYAGPDAPAEEQVAQAQARTRAVSHTVTYSTSMYAPNGTLVERVSPFQRVEHDRSSDLVRITTIAGGSRPDEFTTMLYTQDGIWRWERDETDPETESIEPLHHPYGAEAYQTAATTDASGRVVNRTEETVTVRYPVSTDRRGNPYEIDGHRLVTIDTETGRLVEIRTVRLRDDGYRGVGVTRYHDYEHTTVSRPDLPARPLEWHIYDFFVGPLNGETPLH